MKKSLLIFLICLGAICSHEASAACRAVLIGIEDYPHLPRAPGFSVAMPGPANDVRHMADMLETRYGVAPSDIRVVLNSEATHDGIKSAITEWLPSKLKKGDTALVFYSGHGTRLPDKSHQSGKCDAIVCDNMDRQHCNIKQFILEDELASWFEQLEKRGASVVLIADCCHSGTICRDFMSGVIDKYIPAPKALVKQLGGWPAASKGLTEEASLDGDSNATLIAACLDDQCSESACFPGVAWMGVLTYKLTNYLDSASRNPTYKDIAAYLQKSVAATFNQTPQVSGPDLSQQFLQSAELSPSSTMASAHSSVGDELDVFIKGFGSDAPAVEDEIAKTGYVTTVPAESAADRVLVSSSGPGYRAHFDLRDGTVEEDVSAQSIPDLIKKLRPNLMRAYVGKRLLTTQSEDSSLAPEVSIDSHYAKDLRVRPTAYNPIGTIVRIGEKTVFRFSAAKPCYVTLIDLPTEGPLTVLFPNNYNPASDKVEANHIYRIPSEEMKFNILAAGPPGRDIVIAIASDQPLDLSSLNLSVVNGSAGMSVSNDEEAGARLFEVEGKPDSGVLPGSGFAIAYLVANVVK